MIDGRKYSMGTKMDTAQKVLSEYPRIFDLIIISLAFVAMIVFESLLPLVTLFVYFSLSALYNIIRFHRYTKQYPDDVRERLITDRKFGNGYPLLFMYIGVGVFLLITTTTDVSTPMSVLLLVALVTIVPAALATIMITLTIKYHTGELRFSQ